MNANRSMLMSASLIAAAAAVGAWAYLRLPADATVAVHVGADGRLDGALPKAIGLSLFPLIGAAVVLMLSLAPRLARFRQGLAASAGPLGTITTGLAAVFLAAEGAIVASAIDPSFQAMRFVFVAVGVLLVLTGNLLGKLRYNAVLGLRTPWTLANATVWDKTHRFTGRLMFLAGFVLAAGAALTADARLLAGLMVATAATPPLAGALYSWLIRARPVQA